MPSSKEWLGVFNSALLNMTQAWRWEQVNETDLTPDEAVEIVKGILDVFWASSLCDVCTQPDGAPFFRIGNGGAFEELLPDGWGVPAGEYELPPIPPREGGTADDKRCLAAANAANVLKLAYEEITDLASQHLTTAEAITEFLIWALTIFAAPFVAILAALLAVAAILFAVAYEAAEFVTMDYWSTEFDDKLKCALYECAVISGEDVVTFDFDCFNLKLANKIDLTDNYFELLLFGQIQAMLMFIGGDGLNQAGATTAISTSDCSGCAIERCYEWNFEDDAGMWEIYPGQPGTWTSGQGFEPGLTFAGGDPSRGRRQTIIQMTVPSGVRLTAIGASVDSTIGNVSATSNDGIWANNFAETLVSFTPYTESFLIGWGDPDGRDDFATIQVVFAVGGCDGCGDPGGSGRMWKLQITGYWDGDPFTGGYSCE